MTSFLQSTEWGKFQESVGRKVFWIEKKLVIKHDLPLGLCYLYCPRPDFKDEKMFKKFIHEVKEIAKAENAVFIKIEPDLIKNFDIENLLKISNFKFQISKNLQPKDTILLDLNQSEQEILANMHPKTRYNIRLAEKHKIKITHSTNVEDIETFYQLAIKTSTRDKFFYHSKKYYQKMMKVLGKNKMVGLYTAYSTQNSKVSDGVRILRTRTESSDKNQNHNSKLITDRLTANSQQPIASILVLFYQDTAIYLHGASDHQYRQFMAPYLLQWQAIRDAKKFGCKTYDFWGVQPQTGNLQLTTYNLQPHPWAGITRFKMGFAPNGQIIHYPAAFDLILQAFWYSIYKLIRK